MASGIRAEIRVDAAGTCPVAETAREADASTLSVCRSSAAETPEVVTEEFMLDADQAAVDASDTEFESVFTYGEKTVYRFTRERGHGCPCEVVEAFDCPVADVQTRDDDLYLVFHARDVTQLQEIVGQLQEEFPAVDVQRLLRSEGDPGDHNLVFVDRSRLTERQRTVLETAHRMGYFEYPREANASEVAAELDISQSTFTEHLAAAQRKLLDAVLDS